MQVMVCKNHVGEILEFLVPIPSGDHVSTNVLPQLSVGRGALPCTSKKPSFLLQQIQS